MNYLSYYFKAIIGFIAPGAILIGSAVRENSAGGELITQGEWITALVAAIVTAAGVAVASNGPKPGVPNGEGERRGDGQNY